MDLLQQHGKKKPRLYRSMLFQNFFVVLATLRGLSLAIVPAVGFRKVP